MTLIAAWFTNEKGALPAIWTVGDTQISDSLNNAITLEGSKILELTVKCKDLTTPAQRKPSGNHIL